MADKFKLPTIKKFDNYSLITYRGEIWLPHNLVAVRKINISGDGKEYSVILDIQTLQAFEFTNKKEAEAVRNKFLEILTKTGE